MYHILNTSKTKDFKIVEIYEYYDFPLLFSCIDPASQIYIAFIAKRRPDYEMWLYVAVSPARFNLIRSGNIDLFDTFTKPENDELIQIIIPRNDSVKLSSELVSPTKLPEDIFPPVNDYLDIEYMPYVPETSIANIAETAVEKEK